MANQAEDRYQIGVARMLSNGTIVMDLRAIRGQGVGDARIVYEKSSDHYQEIVKHLGGLKPGEEKPVYNWK
jgi:hypothetical protein